jgi:ABC-2 type transport system permease protein
VNILNIALKEIKSSLRDVRSFILMIAFPIVLMLILGTALTNAFSGGIKLSDMRLLYHTETSNPNLEAYWNEFVKAAEKQGIRMVQGGTGTGADMDGREAVRENRYTGYAVLTDDGIQFYGSSKDTIEGNIIQGMLTAFADRYNLAAAAMKEAPAAVQSVLAGAGAGTGGTFVRETSIQADKKPGSLDYYAMAMTTMFALYSAMSGSQLIRSEHVRKTSIRLAASPASRAEIFTGKVLACTFVNFLFMLALVLFSKIAFNADWGSDIVTVLLVLATEVLLAVSIGLGISYLFKEDQSVSYVMIIIQIASFTGGAYFPLGETKGIVHWLLNLNPLTWANTALTQLIYSDEYRAAFQAIGLNLGVAAAFLLAAVLIMRSREAL